MAHGAIDDELFPCDVHTAKLLWLTGYNGMICEDFNGPSVPTLKKDLIVTSIV